MGVLQAIGDFLFGKKPDIFDDKGNVLHKLPSQKWQGWEGRFKANPDLDWRQHSGVEIAEGKVKSTAPKSEK